MSFLGGIMKSFLNPMNLASLAMGPAGWAQIATRTLFSAVGQQMGLPQSVIDMAQAQFTASTGDIVGARMNVREAVQSLGEQFGLSPLQEGQLEQAALKDLNNLVASLAESKDAKEARSRGGKGDWLMAIAESMGRQLDEKATKLENMSNELSDSSPRETLNKSPNEMKGKAHGAQIGET